MYVCMYVCMYIDMYTVTLLCKYIHRTDVDDEIGTCPKITCILIT